MTKKQTLAAVSAALVAASIVAATAPNATAAISPPQLAQPSGQTIAGISCDAQEGSRIHIHQHLVIIDRGNTLPIPPNVGQPAAKRCLYWVHTHTPDGIIHIEAPQNRTFTLGDFFSIWGQPLSKTNVSSAVAGKGGSLKVWVDGKPYRGDPRKIPLVAHADIVIQAGPPFVTPPRFTTWGTL